VYSVAVAILIALAGIKYSVSNQASENEGKGRDKRRKKLA